MLVDPPSRRAMRFALSVSASLTSLALPVGAMLASLNLQV